MASESAVFQALGCQVAQRIVQMGVMKRLNRSLWIVALIALLSIVALRLSGTSSPLLEWSILGGLTFFWVGAVIVFRVLKRPAPFAALAAWEELSSGKSTLSSAQFFEAQGEHTPGEQLHLARAETLRQERLQHLASDLPIPSPHWSWLLLIPVTGFLFTSYLKPTLSAEDLLMSEDMQARAEAEAQKLAEEQEELQNLDSLTDEERKDVEELSEMLEETSEFLADAGSKSSREVLEALEARARDAERMANRLGADDDVWASDAMLEEMSQHADTAELAEAIRDKDADLSADESEELAVKLQAEELTTEVETRIGTALERTMTKATDEDKDKPVGEHVGNASGKLDKDQARPAGQEFRYLADHFRDLARRERAKEKLKELAEKLRESGNNIAQSQLQQMQQLSGGNQNPQAQQPPQGAQSLSQAPPMMPQNFGNQPQMQQPGQGQGMPQGQGMQPAPVPGMGMQQLPAPGTTPNQQQMGIGQLGQGQQQGQQGQGLMAPVPSQAPNSGSPAMMLGGNSAFSAPGLQAGFGTAKMGTDATENMKSSRDSMVDAQINQDGDSTFRTVQGGVRRETAERAAQEQSVEFLAVEEEALDEQALPVSRRDQELKYFTALREQFEESGE